MKIRNLLITTAILLSIASMILSVGSILYVGDFSKDTEIVDTDDFPPDNTPEATDPEATEPVETELYTVTINPNCYGGAPLWYSTEGFGINPIDISYGSVSIEIESNTPFYVWCDQEGSTESLPNIVWQGDLNYVSEFDSYGYGDYTKGIIFIITGDCDIDITVDN